MYSPNMGAEKQTNWSLSLAPELQVGSLKPAPTGLADSEQCFEGYARFPGLFRSRADRFPDNVCGIRIVNLGAGALSHLLYPAPVRRVL